MIWVALVGLGLLLIGVPVAFALGLAGIVGVWLAGIRISAAIEAPFAHIIGTIIQNLDVRAAARLLMTLYLRLGRFTGFAGAKQPERHQSKKSKRIPEKGARVLSRLAAGQRPRAAFAQESRSVTARLNTAAPGCESTRSATK